MSKTRVVPVTLDELIENSTHIVVAVLDAPPGTSEDVPVVENGKTYPPYRRWINRYRVRESLRGDLRKGAAIEIVAANDSTLEHVHRLYETEGARKSYYDRQYKPQAGDAKAGGPLILFIRQHAATGNRYSFVAGQGLEGLGMRSEIERRLRQKSP